jgi:hypothetical protein
VSLDDAARKQLASLNVVGGIDVWSLEIDPDVPRY